MGMAPFVVSSLLANDPGTALGIFVVAGALDGVDGWIARRFNQGSILGSYLDPLADKVLVAATAVALGLTGGLPAWAVAVMVGRDVLLLGGGLYFRALIVPRDVPFFSTAHMPPVVPSFLSKTNTALQLLLICCGLTDAVWAGVPGGEAVTALAAITTGTTVASGWDYWTKRPWLPSAKRK
jgi:cardiolipin synthase